MTGGRIGQGTGGTRGTSRGVRSERYCREAAYLNGRVGTTIITSSYEARTFGIRTGMRLREARQRCPHLIQRSARPQVYAAVSTAIMQALLAVTPDLQVYSVDEAFLDVTHCQRLHGTPPRMGRMAKHVVYGTSLLSCSVGVAANKAVAKWASEQMKPDGFVVVPPWESRVRLADVPVTALCGVGDGIGAFLAERGALTCGEVARLPVSELARRWGNIGRRIWLMCRGEDFEPVRTRASPPQMLGHGKVLPPGTRERSVVLRYFQHMSEKLAARLRRHGLEAQHFFIGLQLRDGWIMDKLKLTLPGHDGKLIFRLCRFVVENHWKGQEVEQVQVTALDPRPAQRQDDLFEPAHITREALLKAVDAINERYGEFTIVPATLLERSPLPDVISPAWKPEGPRRNV